MLLGLVGAIGLLFFVARYRNPPEYFGEDRFPV